MIIVRSTNYDDVPALKSMLYDAWHETYASFLGAQRVDLLTKMWHTPEKLESEVNSAADASFVVIDGDRIVGHALATDEGEGHVHLKRLYLRAAYYCKGLGDQLLTAALSSFPDGLQASLEVYEVNARAVAFYQKHDFSISERLRDEFADDELYEFRMVRTL